MATLRYNIGAADPIILVVAPGDAAKGLRFHIDDELLELTGFDKYPYRGGTRPNVFGVDPTRWIVNRGVDTTTRASHSAGATLAAVVSASIASADLTPPDPVVPAGGGGAVDSVNGQTGVVLLDAGDVGADVAGAAATAQSAAIAAAATDATTKANAAQADAVAASQPVDSFLTDLSGYTNFDALVDALKPYFLEPD